VGDPRVEQVRELDPPDTSTAALTALLAPSVLATDNRKHFRPLGLPSMKEVKTDAIAIDLFGLGRFVIGVKGTLLFPTLAGALTIDSSKKVAAKLGSDVAAVLGLLILGGAVLFLTSDRGRDLRRKLGEIARQAGPHTFGRRRNQYDAWERHLGDDDDPHCPACLSWSELDVPSCAPCWIGLAAWERLEAARAVYWGSRGFVLLPQRR